LNDITPNSPQASFGGRLRQLRDSRGMTRETLGGLAGKTGRWVKALETGHLQMPRLPVLISLAGILRADLAELTGNPDVPAGLLAGPGHPALPAVRDAVNSALWVDGPAQPLNVLQARLDAAWRARHAAPDHRTVLGAILPSLIRDCQRAVRQYQGNDGRRAQAIMTGTWNLSQFFLAYQPDAGLLWRVADRAVLAAQESGSPHAVGSAVWLLAQKHRDAGEFDAAEEVNAKALELLRPHLGEAGDELAAIWGALLFEAAYTAARRGERGTAWRYWDQAGAVARRLPGAYYDPMTSFSRVIMGAHAVTVAVELRQGGEGLRQARRGASLAIPSQPRRGRHLIEAARALRHGGDEAGALGMLNAAYRTAPETIRWNGPARAMTAEMAAAGPGELRRDAAALAERIGVAA
jgi:transcriptional regulator with XRE-family HTH domain